MNKLDAEAQVLDRLMYMLEERSVRHLMETDQCFANYIEELYRTLNNESLSLHS